MKVQRMIFLAAGLISLTAAAQQPPTQVQGPINIISPSVVAPDPNLGDSTLTLSGNNVTDGGTSVVVSNSTRCVNGFALRVYQGSISGVELFRVTCGGAIATFPSPLPDANVPNAASGSATSLSSQDGQSTTYTAGPARGGDGGPFLIQGRNGGKAFGSQSSSNTGGRGSDVRIGAGGGGFAGSGLPNFAGDGGNASLLGGPSGIATGAAVPGTNGSVQIDAGYGAGTKGNVTIGTSFAGMVTIGKAGRTVSLAGDLSRPGNGQGVLSISGSTSASTAVTGSKCVCVEQTTPGVTPACSVSGSTLTATLPTVPAGTDLITYWCWQ